MKEEIELVSEQEAMLIFGKQDSNLKRIREAFGVELVARNTTIRLSGRVEDVQESTKLLNRVIEKVRDDKNASDTVVSQMIEEETVKRRTQRKRFTASEHHLVPMRSKGQEHYVGEIVKNDITFCIGPAGTGKTYLAVMLAVSYLQKGLVQKIVLVRPAVEAGEKLGFLPGDFHAKVNPYLRPLYDALFDLLSSEQVRRYKEKDIIEIVPLAYMRGRTLNRAFVILDEAQNTTDTQMKMLLTRMGEGAKAVITGDITQIDLPKPAMSGLIIARKILKNIRGVGFIALTSADIVRHPVIERIIDAYERHKKRD